MESLSNFIGGQSVPPRTGAYLDNIEPATGRTSSRVPDSGPDDINNAVAAARAAFASWAGTAAAERARIMHRLADLIERDLDRLARAESIDTGKPIALARSVDIPRCATNFRFFAAACTQSASEFHDAEGWGGVGGGAGGVFSYTLRRPRGVAGLISPWNLPLYLLTWKIAPAIASGNTCVCKPSEVTPMTAYLLGDLLNEAGVPAGVVNIVHGSGPGAGASLVMHDDMPAISFTGSTAVGKWIAEHAGPKFKRLSLELGGKNPFIIFDDAELNGEQGAIATAARAAFTNQGQICLCGSRLLVQRGVFERVLTGLIERAKSLKIGDPLDEATQFGALTSAPHLDKVASYIDKARTMRGTIHCGGERVDPAALPERCRGGLFHQPTVISGLDPACPVEQEEIFGPVVTLQPFDTDEQAIALANSTPYGLAASIWTRDASRLHRTAAAVNAGVVWANCWMVRDLRTPFGGMKQSGVGREGGQEAMRFFTEPKAITIRI
ncbi:MAG: aldehyde dehydrogenase [Phycisphaeraceae bacterium]|nr:aldehyde dehydrogenase [Phycisphaeraceae bacterium]